MAVGRHGVDESLGKIRIRRCGEDGIVTSLLRQEQSAAFHIVGSDDFPLRHFSRLLVLRDLAGGHFKAVRRVAQEDDAEHRHAVFRGSQLRVRAEIVSGLPEVGFEFFDALEGGVGHSGER